MDNLILSGQGDNTLLICAEDNCTWSQGFPMAEPLASFIQAATTHIKERHTPTPSTYEEEFHSCHFCGTLVLDGKESDGKRHHLSDCRPDLTPHEPGDLCTWAYRRKENNFREADVCYAYQNPDTKEWTDSHSHFYKDGPM